jgi:predicted molibdopterin-dependent oxidoreductase YjgC
MRYALCGPMSAASRMGASTTAADCAGRAHPSNTRARRFCTRQASRSGGRRFRAIDFRPTPETTTAEFPFLLLTGRTLYQFNAGTMTGRSQTHQLRPTDVLEMSPADASRLQVGEGEWVTLTSRYGRAALPVPGSPWMKPGELFATFHDPAVFLNDVTGPHRDSTVGTPEYKITAVRIEKGRP